MGIEDLKIIFAVMAAWSVAWLSFTLIMGAMAQYKVNHYATIMFIVIVFVTIVLGCKLYL